MKGEKEKIKKKIKELCADADVEKSFNSILRLISDKKNQEKISSIFSSFQQGAAFSSLDILEKKFQDLADEFKAPMACFAVYYFIKTLVPVDVLTGAKGGPVFFNTDAVEKFIFLLDMGVNPDLIVSSGQVPLLLLVLSAKFEKEKDGVEICRILKDKGADFNLHCREFNTNPLNFVVGNPDPVSQEIAEFVIDSVDKDEINKIGQGGLTPLQKAVNQKNFGIVKKLLERGANPNLANKEKLTALHYAVKNGKEDIVKILLEKGANPNSANKEKKFTALHYAAQTGNIPIIKQLIENGADIEAKAQFGFTPLSIAGSFSSPSCVKALLSLGANPNVCVYEGHPILSTASLLSVLIEKGSYDAAKMLIQHEKTNPNFCGEDQSYPLHEAAKKPDAIDIFRNLINKAGIIPNPVDLEGNTPFYYAAVHGNIEAINLLREHRVGPPHEPINKVGRSPITAAVVAQCSEKVLSALLDFPDLDLNKPDGKGLTPIHYVAMLGKKELLKILIEHNASLVLEAGNEDLFKNFEKQRNQKNLSSGEEYPNFLPLRFGRDLKSGKTYQLNLNIPLALALSQNKVELEVIRLLLNSSNQHQYKPGLLTMILEYVVIMNYIHVNKEVASYLLEQGVKPNDTTILKVIHCGNKDLLKAFISSTDESVAERVKGLLLNEVVKKQIEDQSKKSDKKHGIKTNNNQHVPLPTLQELKDQGMLPKDFEHYDADGNSLLTYIKNHIRKKSPRSGDDIIKQLIEMGIIQEITQEEVSKPVETTSVATNPQTLFQLPQKRKLRIEKKPASEGSVETKSIPVIYEQPKVAPSMWFGGITSESPNVKAFSNAPNCYCFTDLSLIDKSCPEDQLKLFEKKLAMPRFGEYDIKKITFEAKIRVKVDVGEGKPKSFELTHEVKIEGKSRLFCIKMLAEDGASLYVPIIYSENGLHKTADVKSLEESIKNRVFQLPIKQVTATDTSTPPVFIY